MGKEITQDIFWESRSLMCDKVREITESYQTYPLFLTQYQQQQFQSGNACWGSTTLLLLGKQIITKVISWKLAAQREEKWPPKAWTQNLTCLDQLINSFFIYLFFFQYWMIGNNIANLKLRAWFLSELYKTGSS